MAIHVQDAETDWLVRDFAKRRGVGITAAIKLAIHEASRNENLTVDMLSAQLEPIWEQLRRRRQAPFEGDKAFMDEGWGEPD